ncbi:hypothetical protein KSP40_PGU022298 [Platanthera guangdongensis]|uniref:Uncharacterized protein n=1 Tax=Platanthera guangdongensis TaxID=2320717 RepID=A0ABR2N4S3_9ASPA
MRDVVFHSNRASLLWFFLKQLNSQTANAKISASPDLCITGDRAVSSFWYTGPAKSSLIR